MTSPLDKMIDKACGVASTGKDWRELLPLGHPHRPQKWEHDALPLGHPGSNAFVFRIEEDCYHAELFGKFHIAKTKELQAIQRKLEAMPSHYPAELRKYGQDVAQIIENAINAPDHDENCDCGA